MYYGISSASIGNRYMTIRIEENDDEGYMLEINRIAGREKSG